MKKLIFSLTVILLTLSLTTSGQGITFTSNKDWKGLLALAKKEKKIIFLDAYATWCGPCKYMQQEVFSEAAVGAFYNKNFINAKIDMEEGEGISLSETLNITAYPTLLFISSEGKVLHKYIGALEPEGFLELGKEALDPLKQFYPMKSKAALGLLNPKVFHNWVHAANKLRDEDTDKIVSDYLTNAKYPLLEKEMLGIALEHASLLSEKQLKEIGARKKEAKELLSWTEEDFNNAYTQRVVNYASKNAVNKPQGTADFVLFEKLVKQYVPSKASLETQKAKVDFYMSREEVKKGLDELSVLIGNPMYQLPALELASLINDYVENMIEAGRTKEFISKVEGFKLKPQESTMTYYKDFTLLTIYYHLDDKLKVAALATKISKSKGVPTELRDLVDSL